MNYKSIKIKLMIGSIVLGLLFLLSISSGFYIVKQNVIEESAHQKITAGVTHIISEIQEKEIRVKENLLVLSEIANKDLSQKQIKEISYNIFNKEIFIVSGGIWYENNTEPIFLNRDDKEKLYFIENYDKKSSLDYKEMDFYNIAKDLKKGEIYWTNVYTDSVTNNQMITASTPMFKNDKFIGIISIDIKTNRYQNDISAFEKSYFMILDRNGDFVAKSNNITMKIKNKSFLEENEDSLYFVDNDKILNEDSVIFIFHFEDSELSLLVGITEHEALLELNETYNIIIIITLLMTILASILGFSLLKKSVITPLEKINNQLLNDNFENGHYKILECKDKGEIGYLVDNLNKRTTDLEKSQESEKNEIEKRRTQEKLLVQQSKMAAMGEMMDAVAHQWKQPLNALTMYADIIKGDVKDGIVDEKYISEYRNDIHSQIGHMTNTLDEFRTFFRPNKEEQDFSIQKTVESVLFLTKDEFIKNRIDVQTDITDFSIHGSENEFKHLILNIINNAKDAFNDNNITVKRIIKIRAKSNIIEIEDNAGGIPDAVIKDIFKANVTTKEEGKGTGIGLYMSIQIAEKHKAKLTVKNVNNGACFKIKIDEEI